MPGAPTLWQRGRVPVASSSVQSNPPGMFQTRTRWTLKPVRANGPTSFPSTSSDLPSVRWQLYPLLHLNGILRPTRRLIGLLFRPVGPSICPPIPPGFRRSDASIVMPPRRHLGLLDGFRRNFFFLLHPISPPSYSLDAGEGGIVIPGSFQTRGYRSCLHSSHTLNRASTRSIHPVFPWLPPTLEIEI